MMTPHQPTATHLFNIPYLMNGKACQMLVYTNDLQVSFREALMIVAIPNPNQVDNFGLVDVSTDEMKHFRKQAKLAGDKLIPWQYTLSANYSKGFFSDERSDSLAIHRVGNYDISVAPTLEALEKQINWNHFQLPADFQQRKSTFSNQGLFPFPCAYVVAKAVKSVEDDGFGIVFPDPGFAYFPTCHEKNHNNHHDYDVRCYHWGPHKRNYFPFVTNNKSSFCEEEGNKMVNVSPTSDKGNYFATSYHSTNSDCKDDLFRYLPHQCVMSKDGISVPIHYNEKEAQIFNYCPIKTYAINQNIAMGV